MKKIVALLLAAVMVFAMGTVAFASEGGTADGSITIQNTVPEKEYEVFKVFDATYSGDNVSYTYDGSNATFLAALQADSSPFTVTQNASGSYNVVRKENATDADIISFIEGQEGNFGDAVETLTGNGKAQTVDGLDYGYYYITTTTGSAVTIDSALKDVTVIDKNEELPPPDKQESFDKENWVIEGDANIGDTISYKVTGKINRYQGEEVITSITLTDTLDKGLTRNQDAVLKVDGTTLVAGTDYTISYSGQDMVIKVTTATVDADGNPTFIFDTGVDYELTYSAVLNEDAVVDGDNINTIKLVWNDDNDAGEDSTIVRTYDFLLKKTDGTDFLNGAGFRLYDAQTGGNEITVAKDSTGYYKSATGSEEIMVDSADGVNVRGLKPGTYYLEETTTPPGFNPLPGRTEVVITSGATAPVEITVVNESGNELPSTGGIGTTMFYIVGSVLVIGAAVVLITKRRMAR